MSHARVLGIVGLAALTAAAVAYAQTTVTPIPDTAPVETAPLEPAKAEKATWGDVQNGQALAGTCAACHGLDGNPAIEMYPRLAGQSERYIAHQLALFKSGERNDAMAAVMKPFADMLSAQDARDVGAWFATQKSGAGVADDTLVTSGPFKDRKFYEIGEQLFMGGDPARGIPACMACHGPDGGGNPGPAYPHVAGQQAGYTQQRLELYRAGVTERRDTHLFDMMASITRQLTDEEIGSLASYLQGLHPSANDVVAMAGGAPVAVPTAPAATPATDQITAPADDTGTDQPAEPATDTGATNDSQAADDAATGTEDAPADSSGEG